MDEGTGVTNRGNTYYVDFERIRKVDGYVYYWVLDDYLKPNKNGKFSGKLYKQGDCKLFRFKYLSFSFYNEPMGGGTGEIANPKHPGWEYFPPNSMGEIILKSVCKHAK